MIYSKLFKFFIKELSTSKVQIIKVFFTIFISLLIFSTVLIFRNNIENEISNNSRVLLGGDFELSSKNKPLNPEFLDELKKSYLLTKIFEFTSILRSENGQSKTIRIKVKICFLTVLSMPLTGVWAYFPTHWTLVTFCFKGFNN